MLAVKDIAKAIEIYYGRTQLDGGDIKELFGKVSAGAAVKLRKKARVVMLQKGYPIWDKSHVETKSAFEAWGLDISDLEARYKKLKSLGLAEKRDAG